MGTVQMFVPRNTASVLLHLEHASRMSPCCDLCTPALPKHACL